MRIKWFRDLDLMDFLIGGGIVAFVLGATVVIWRLKGVDSHSLKPLHWVALAIFFGCWSISSGLSSIAGKIGDLVGVLKEIERKSLDNYGEGWKIKR